MKGWICYPIWGLEIAEHGFGLEQPIFGDATIIPRSYLQKQAPADAISMALFSGGGLRTVLETGTAEMAGPAPVERLIDIPPDAFIAVRRKKPEDALRYAESIRALLTATAVLTSGQAKGFAMTPLPLHWSAIPSRVQLNRSGQLEVDYKIVASNFIHLTPIRVTHKDLRESWQSGSPVQGSWKIHKEDPLSKVLVGDWNSLSGLRKRLRSAASTLARAMESTDATLSTLFATVALELLLKDGSTDFKELEEMAGSIFSGANGAPEISRLFTNRHKIAHEALAPVREADHSQEIAAAWAIILMGAVASEQLATVDEFLEHLRGRVLARRVAEQLRTKGREDLADEVERAATLLGKSVGKP
jgi:hypothetical protein